MTGPATGRSREADRPARADDETTTGEWFVHVWADPDYHELVRARDPGDADGAIDFPSAVTPRDVPLRGEEVRVGRAGTTAQDVPEVDLSGPPRDPGVSHLHAVLLALPHDRWVVLDPGSTNGLTLNYGQEALARNTPVSLQPGDRIHLGAWTTLTVGRR